MKFLGRSVILTTLDPVPRNFRAVPGYLTLNLREMEAIKNNNDEVVKELFAIVLAETRGDALNIWRRR